MPPAKSRASAAQTESLIESATETSRLLDRLEQKSRDFACLADRISLLIDGIQERLNHLPAKSSAEVKQGELTLLFARVGSSWELGITVPKDDDDDHYYYRLTDASLEMKITSIPLLQQLLLDILERQSALVSTLERCKPTLDSFSTVIEEARAAKQNRRHSLNPGVDEDVPF